MSYKKTGIILGVVLVLLALAVFVISKIEITPKKEQSKQNQSSVVTTESSKEQKEETTESKKQETTTVDTTTTTEQTEVVEKEDGLSLVKITAEDKLDYSGVQQTTTGVVKSKTCYLIGNQVTYALEIEATMGTESKIIQHFCTYTAYDSIEVGDMLSILYQQTTTNTFSVVSVSK